MLLSGPIGLAVALAAGGAQACLEINGYFLLGNHNDHIMNPFRAVDNVDQAICEQKNCEALERCDLECIGNVNNASVLNMEKFYWNTNHGNFVIDLNTTVSNICDKWCGLAGKTTCCGYALEYSVNTRSFC
ncbi:hypothetical protein CTA2_11091 [Colletotrichum tanaceti]|uniref:Apple domain-containing protein n=1 Tax=Colletotrichum tanaceti TaxID=1306861 RepID=A0A4U6XD00_9PEZI|nr:hypothetical protein CTA2_11091 [Colletotrichum tanaceti]TKW53485.1 hypothetical protein CTA1_13257 [Colletotrichum tanaceti]